MLIDAVDDSLRGIDRTDPRCGVLVAASSRSTSVAASSRSTTVDAREVSRTADHRAEVDHS